MSKRAAFRSILVDEVVASTEPQGRYIPKLQGKGAEKVFSWIVFSALEAKTPVVAAPQGQQRERLC